MAYNKEYLILMFNNLRDHYCAMPMMLPKDVIIDFQFVDTVAMAIITTKTTQMRNGEVRLRKLCIGVGQGQCPNGCV